jgi:hypothetical protein
MTDFRVPFPLLLLGWTIALIALSGTTVAAGMDGAPREPLVAEPQPAAPPAPVLAEPPPPPAPPAPPLPEPPRPPTPTPEPAPTPPTAPAAEPAPAPAPAPEPRPAPAPAPAPPAASGPAGPTSWPELNAAIARIPNYDGGATWIVSDQYGNWGTANLSTGDIYVSPGVPRHRLDDVVRHEWSHIVSVHPYPTARTAADAMNSYFGGTGLTGAERAADCMARLIGASWTRYTACTDPRWRDGARRLLSGEAV